MYNGYVRTYACDDTSNVLCFCERVRMCMRRITFEQNFVTTDVCCIVSSLNRILLYSYTQLSECMKYAVCAHVQYTSTIAQWVRSAAVVIALLSNRRVVLISWFPIQHIDVSSVVRKLTSAWFSLTLALDFFAAQIRFQYWFFLLSLVLIRLAAAVVIVVFSLGYFEYWVEKRQNDKHRRRADKHTNIYTMIKWIRARRKDGKSMLRLCVLYTFRHICPWIYLLFSTSLLYQQSTSYQCVCRLVALTLNDIFSCGVKINCVYECWLTELVDITIQSHI